MYNHTRNDVALQAAGGSLARSLQATATEGVAGRPAGALDQLLHRFSQLNQGLDELTRRAHNLGYRLGGTGGAVEMAGGGVGDGRDQPDNQVGRLHAQLECMAKTLDSLNAALTALDSAI